MELGLHARRWPPDVFWRASLRELAAAAGSSPESGLGRADLERLMDMFPDLP